MVYGKIDLFDVKILNLTKEDVINEIEKIISNKGKEKFYFVNADCFNKAYSDLEYKKILQSAKFVLGDGSGVRYASKIVKTPIIDNVNGTDLLPMICDYAQKAKRKIFLLGAKPNIAEKMKENLLKIYPNLEIVGTHHGYFDWEKQSNEIVNKINDSDAEILLVAFGAPFQEKWINEYYPKINCNIQMGVGGLFDFFSGTIKRAPKWMRLLGIEWIFRLVQEPKRMWRRYILGNPIFIYRLYRWKREKIK